MTTYMLALAGDEQRAAGATHWAGTGKARLLSVSRAARGMAPPGPIEAEHAPVTRDPAALAALLVRTLDLQDGAGVVRADFDSEEFAAAVVAGIAALGRRVTRPGTASRFAFGSVFRSRVPRS